MIRPVDCKQYIKYFLKHQNIIQTKLKIIINLTKSRQTKAQSKQYKQTNVHLRKSHRTSGECG